MNPLREAPITSSGQQRRLMALVLLAPLLFALSTSFEAGASSTTSFARAVLPPGAVASGQVASVNAVSCPGVNTCTAVGSFLSTNGYLPMIQHEVNGVWLAPSTVSMPADAVKSSGPGSMFDQFSAVSCPNTANCVAVGTYKTATGFRPLIAVESAGTWNSAFAGTLPANASSSGQLASLFAVSCVAVGTCTAGGTYVSGTNQLSFVIGEQSGTWSLPLAPTLPTGAVTSFQVAAINALACSKLGNCVAVGSFVNSSGFQAAILTESLGAWGPASSGITLSLPLDATATGDAVANGLNALSCPSTGNCVAVGQYAATGGYSSMIVTQSAGTWAGAKAVAAPATPVFAGSHGATLNAVSCLSVGSCVAVGTYGTSVQQLPFSIASASLVWASAVTGSAPAGNSVPLNAQYSGVRCFAVSACLVIGSYRSSAGTQGMIATPTTAPAPPSGVVATRGNASATVKWTTPAYFGNSPITQYVVTASPGAATCVTTSSLFCKFSGLTNGVAYKFTVTAANAVGVSTKSSASNTVVPATIPGAPSIVSVVALKGALKVTILAPTNNGGAPITTYHFSVNGGATWHIRSTGTTSTTINIVGLARHHLYKVSIRAVNAVGTGASSRVVAATTL